MFRQHDSTVIAALASLDLLASEAHIIPYCATLMLELHHTDVSGWFVQLHYKNSTAEDATAYKFTIPGTTRPSPCIAPPVCAEKSLEHTKCVTHCFVVCVASCLARTRRVTHLVFFGDFMQ